MGLTADGEERLNVEAVGGREAEPRRATYSGLPCGGRDFVEELEERFGRRLHALPPGPRSKPKAAGASAGGRVG